MGRDIVAWEGDCETGFYSALMRPMKGYPAEFLMGINGGNNLEWLVQWFKSAEYKIVAVIDGDNREKLNNLQDKMILFSACR